MLKTNVQLPSDDHVLFDWLTFTTKIYDERSVLDFLGLSEQPFQLIERGRFGYRQRLQFENINIYFDGTESMGICVDMSGTGCRAFETFSTVSWEQILCELRLQPDDFKITRLDCAFDDLTGILDMNHLLDDTDAHRYVSRSRIWKVEYGSEGSTIYHGSNKSDMLIRIYDKAAEQDLEEVHWIRVELQMRDQIAAGFVDGCLLRPVGEQFRGVLHNYLRYVTPVADTNMSRWPMTDYWETLLQSVGRIRCWYAPGMEYDVHKLRNYVINQAGNALDCYLKIFGIEDLVRELGNRSIRFSPKYERLIDQYREFQQHRSDKGSE